MWKRLLVPLVLSLAPIACAGDGPDPVASATMTLATAPCPDVTGVCLRGFSSTSYLSDANRCVPNLIAQFTGLKERGELMGFWDGGSAVAYPSLDTDKDHWQGIQRLPFPRSQYMILTSSGESAGGHYALVNLGTRVEGAFTGGRFGANRMTTVAPDWRVEPSSSDTILQGGTITDALTYSHPSGIQTLGRYLAIPAERVGGATNMAGRTELFDTGATIDRTVSRCGPNTPGCIQSRWTFHHSSWGNAAVALAKLDDGRYVMLNALTSDSKQIEVNVSRLGKGGFPISIGTPGVFGESNWAGRGAYSARHDMVGLAGWADYQGLQLLTECGTGHLYLVGTQDISGEDWAHLYRLNLRDTGKLNGDGEPVVSSVRESTFVRIASKHFWCGARSSPRQCDFAAAAGMYVDPNGALIAYASVHDDSGLHSLPGFPPPLVAPGVTRFVEFSGNDPIDHPDTVAVEGCDTQYKMWVELSNGQLVGDRPTVGSDRFFIEFARESRSKASFADAYDFNDVARSIRYCIPSGFRYKLCSDASFGGTCTFFCGDSLTGCVGAASGGAVRGWNLGSATSSSGCFTSASSNACL